MPDSSQPTIVIVGGGPAGVAAALHLCRIAPDLAAQTLVLEAKEYPRPKLCGGGITIHGEEQLETLGISLDVCDFIVDQLVFSLNGSAFTIARPHAMRVIQRAEFDAALARAAREQGVRIHHGERLLDLTPQPDGYLLRTNRAEYRPTVVVAADGANSTVRQKVGMQNGANIARLLRVLTPIDPAESAAWQERSAVFDFTCIRDGIPGYAWDFPCYIDGVPHMNRGIFDSRLTNTPFPQARGALKNSFYARMAAQGVDTGTVELKGHPVRWFDPHAEFARPHLLLIGDAAGVDPLFAEGISYGMEYGEIAAQAIVDAFAAVDFTFRDYRRRLLAHRLGGLLRRRTAVARTLYRHHLPPLWGVVFHLADYSPRRVQDSLGAALALLPASKG